MSPPKNPLKTQLRSMSQVSAPRCYLTLSDHMCARSQAAYPYLPEQPSGKHIWQRDHRVLLLPAAKADPQDPALRVSVAENKATCSQTLTGLRGRREARSVVWGLRACRQQPLGLGLCLFNGVFSLLYFPFQERQVHLSKPNPLSEKGPQHSREGAGLAHHQGFLTQPPPKTPKACSVQHRGTLLHRGTKPFSECKAAGFLGRFPEFLLQLHQTKETSGDDWAKGSVKTQALAQNSLGTTRRHREVGRAGLTSRVRAAR